VATLTRVPAAALIPVVYLIAVTPALVRTDLRERRLPNRIVLPGIVVGLIAAALQPSLLPVLAALGYGGLLLVLSLAGGVGMGDVKLAALIGLACPAASAAVGAPIAAFLLGGAVASVAVLRHGRGARIAFGPAMLAGYWVALVGSLLPAMLLPGMLGSGTSGISP
jgi:leader peptidase (prepilin peptidase)/N-methyltransferase